MNFSFSFFHFALLDLLRFTWFLCFLMIISELFFLFYGLFSFFQIGPLTFSAILLLRSKQQLAFSWQSGPLFETPGSFPFVGCRRRVFHKLTELDIEVGIGYLAEQDWHCYIRKEPVLQLSTEFTSRNMEGRITLDGRSYFVKNLVDTFLISQKLFLAFVSIYSDLLTF